MQYFEDSHVYFTGCNVQWYIAAFECESQSRDAFTRNIDPTLQSKMPVDPTLQSKMPVNMIVLQNNKLTRLSRTTYNTPQ